MAKYSDMKDGTLNINDVMDLNLMLAYKAKQAKEASDNSARKK